MTDINDADADGTSTSPGSSPAQAFLTLTGLVVSTVGIIYLATVFFPRLSEWGQFTMLLLITLGYGAAAVFVDGLGLDGAFFDLRGFRWLTLPSALFLLSGVGALVTTIFFVNMDVLGQEVKVAVAIVVGIALLGAGAWVGRERV